MKILFVVGQFPCISETFVLNQVVGLTKMGHDVRVVTFGKPEKDIVHEEYQKYNIESKVIRLDNPIPHNKIKRFLHLLAILRKLYSTVGIQCFELLNWRKYGKIAYNGLLVHCSQLFFKLPWKPDAIIAHFADIGLYTSAYHHCGLLKTPAFVVVHAHEIAALTTEGINKKYKPLFDDELTYILPISKYWYDKLVKSGADCNRLKVFHMGVDLNYFHYHPRLGRTAGNVLKILSVGRLVGQKGYEYSVNAVIECHGRGVPVQYSIIGTGKLMDKLNGIINENNASEYIHLLGVGNNEKVLEEMRNNDLFILASVTDDRGLMEGIPVALMEAMAIGIPVISSYHSGIPELIENEKEGWLCQEKNVEEISQKIEYAYHNIDKCEQVIKAARLKIEREYSLEVLLIELVEIIKQLADGQHG